VNVKNIPMVVAACLAGFLGGILSPLRRVGASPSTILRASKFELVNASGVPLAELSADRNVSLRFLTKGSTAVEIGILPGGHPFLQMLGRDGKRRIVMDLDEADKPMLGMGDERWEGRVHIGFIAPDSSPYGDWDQWGISLRAFGSEHAVVGMSTAKTGPDHVEGSLTVGGRVIQ
jgi:hypothetical protein